MSLARTILGPLASLRLTVVLFALAMVLIFAGTLAQVNEGIWTVVERYFRSFLVRIEFQLFVPKKVATIPGAFVFPGGLLLEIVLLVNLLAAHAVRFKLSWKRSGIILTHAGVILLIAGEIATGLFADEGNMSIDEGETAAYVEDTRTSELAIIDPSGASDDLVVVVPQRMLAHAAGAPITHPLLPFQVTVNEWMPNSRLLGPMQSTPEQRARADSGLGRQIAATPQPRATGVESDRMDIPSAYVTLTKDGKRLGSFLVSVFMQEAQPVIVDGTTFTLQLRFRRTYKPYSVELIDFRHDKFVGTERPRNFSSLVRLRDPARSVDRQVLISMNNPLRYAGDTLYQASFKPDNSGTVLQVVRNPAWLVPYVSCAMVTLGMLLHFWIRSAGKPTRRSA